MFTLLPHSLPLYIQPSMMDELFSEVSQPVHHALRLEIKNCKHFTIAIPLLPLPLRPPPPSHFPPQPRLSSNHTCHTITTSLDQKPHLQVPSPPQPYAAPTHNPHLWCTKHLHSSKLEWVKKIKKKKHNLFCTSQIIYFFSLSFLQEFSISL